MSMYPYYQPIKPTSNLYLQKAIDDQKYYDHMRRLTKIQNGIGYQPIYSYSPPVNFPHLVDRNKAAKHDGSKTFRDYSEVSKRVDDRNLFDIRNYFNLATKCYEKRQRNAIRQSQDNLMFMQRLTGVKPTISAAQQQKDWHKHQNYVKMASRYPNNWQNVLNEENRLKRIELKRIKNEYGKKAADVAASKMSMSALQRSNSLPPMYTQVRSTTTIKAEPVATGYIVEEENNHITNIQPVSVIQQVEAVPTTIIQTMQPPMKNTKILAPVETYDAIQAFPIQTVHAAQIVQPAFQPVQTMQAYQPVQTMQAFQPVQTVNAIQPVEVNTVSLKRLKNPTVVRNKTFNGW